MYQSREGETAKCQLKAHYVDAALAFDDNINILHKSKLHTHVKRPTPGQKPVGVKKLME